MYHICNEYDSNVFACHREYTLDVYRMTSACVAGLEEGKLVWSGHALYMLKLILYTWCLPMRGVAAQCHSEKCKV